MKKHLLLIAVLVIVLICAGFIKITYGNPLICNENNLSDSLNGDTTSTSKSSISLDSMSLPQRKRMEQVLNGETQKWQIGEERSLGTAKDGIEVRVELTEMGSEIQSD